MSETLTKVVVDCATGQQQVLPLTAEEIADLEAARAQAEADRLAAEEAAAEAAAAKASGIAKLLALGLTEAEANALVK
ncbi:MAG: hypothetical protein FJ356_06130 [Thaumarchaeota archaeon]|nr:hypothetical protein [Nitrososphaerota archaeon]